MSEASHTASVERLIKQFSRLPGIGKRSAERIAFALIRQPPDEAFELARAITDMRTTVKQCSVCSHVSEADPCPICSDPRRDRSQILVVEEPKDVHSFESTGMYRGLYHVLMGRLAALDGIGPGELTIEGLLHRVEQGEVKEVILGTSPTLEGDGTALHLADTLTRKGVTVSRLARGLPTGYSIETASKAVLSDAIHGRRSV